MEHQDFLFIVAEISAVLAGFSTVILIVGTRDDTPAFTAYTFASVIERSFVTVLMALLPALIHSWDSLSNFSWQISSLVFAIYSLVLVFRGVSWWNSLNTEERPISNKGFWWRIFVGASLSVLLMFNVFIGHTGLYLLNLAWMLLSISLLILSYSLSAMETGRT